ncbi:MAG TPA: tripartite tricarboxylate transporter substrate binding protein [Burkholderiaceae bacterium]|nr:tripartite tricarboxylate transporter substrate binding protein [Burkholderiaceae bacterium]
MKHLHRWLALAALAVPLFAQAQAYPSKPIRVVVPFAVGSGTDIVTRVVIDEMQKSMGGTFIVDNKPGASAQIAADFVAKSPPDGYTIFMGTNTAIAANPHLFKKLPYDPIKDFTPIARVNYFVFLLAVGNDLPVKTPKELIARANASANGLTYGHGNSTGQVAGAHFVHGSKIKATVIPYKSTPPALTDLSSGQIDFIFVDLAASQSYLKGGRIRAIAVQSDQRSALVPDLPPVGDTVPGYNFTAWGGLFGPAGMPRDIVARLNAETNKALASPTVKERMAAQGLEPAPMSVEEFNRFVPEQLVLWGERIRAAGIQPE